MVRGGNGSSALEGFGFPSGIAAHPARTLRGMNVTSASQRPGMTAAWPSDVKVEASRDQYPHAVGKCCDEAREQQR